MNDIITPLSSAETLLDKPSRLKITISHALPSDCEDLAEINLLAFRDDPNSAPFHPERVGLTIEELLRTHRPLVAWGLQRSLLEDIIVLKATIPASNPQDRPITAACAIWENPSRTRLKRRTFWEWVLELVIYPIQELFLGKKRAPSLPPSVGELMKRQYDIVFGPGGIAEGQTPWYLHVVAVHPKYQGTGAGRALLEWGRERAEADNVPMYLESR